MYLASPIALVCITVSASVHYTKHGLIAAAIFILYYVLNPTTVMKLIHSDWLIFGA